MSDPLRQIYLVDDDPAILKALSRLLRSAGYETVAFASAKSFMESYSADAPGCLVLDVAMPEITGLELQSWLVQSNSPLPVIFLTGRADIPDSVKAMKAGAIDFLTKPVNKIELLCRIRSLLRVRHLENQLERTLAYLAEFETASRASASTGAP